MAVNDIIFCGQKINYNIKKGNKNIQEKNAIKVNNVQNHQFFYAYALEEYKDAKADINKNEKLKCKYRKNCYNNEEFDFADLKNKNSPSSQPLNKNAVDKLDKVELKQICKYRKSCYIERGFNTKFENKDITKKPITILTSKPQVKMDFEKPTNVKEIAEKAIKKLQKKKKQLVNRPKSSKAEMLLKTVKEEVKNKNACKYRKSCYETGVVPEVKESEWLLKTKYFLRIENEDQQKIMQQKKLQNTKFEDLSNKEQKFFCKYRKSCYESGKLPKILISETAYNNEPTKKQENKISIKERCKFRKSCYENGILPENINKKALVHKVKENILVTSVLDLKQFCKYRKSCYKTMSEKNGKENKIKHEQFKKTVTNNNNTKTKKENIVQITNVKKKESLSAEKINQIFVKNEINEIKKIKGKQSIKYKKAENIKKDATTVASKARPYKKYKKIPKNEKIEIEKLETMEKNQESEIPENDETTQDTVENNQKFAKSIEEIENEEHPAEILIVPKSSGENKSKDSNTIEISSKIEKNIKNVGLDSKFACKYRKSCYIGFDVVINDDKNLFHIVNKINNIESNWSQLKKEEQQKCKYRKSCYASEIIENNFQEKLVVPNDSTKLTYENKQNPKNLNNPHGNSVKSLEEINKEKKQKCKYRNSCYKDIVSHNLFINRTVKNILVNQDIVEDRNRPVFILPNGKTCSKYRVSCRQQVGLPPIERPPIAKNGKKLCRKKKPSLETSNK